MLIHSSNENVADIGLIFSFELLLFKRVDSRQHTQMTLTGSHKDSLQPWCLVFRLSVKFRYQAASQELAGLSDRRFYLNKI